MRTPIRTTFALLCVVGWVLASVVVAQTNEVLRPPQAKGRITAVDMVRRQLTVQLPQGIHTFQATDRTLVFRDAKKITLESLQTNDLVAIQFLVDSEGNLIARRIKIGVPIEPPITAPSTNPGSAIVIEQVQP